MGPVTDVPLLERGSPETNRGPAVADPRIRVCSTVVSAAAPCHARSSGGHLASERIGDEHPCLQLLNRDMRVDRVQRLVPSAMAGTPLSEAAKAGTICQTRSTRAASSNAGRTSPPPCTGFSPGLCGSEHGRLVKAA